MYLVVIYPINSRIFPGEKTVGILFIEKSLKHWLQTKLITDAYT